MTKKFTAGLALVVLVALHLTGCADFNRNWAKTWQTLHDGSYMVAGRVTNLQSVPIGPTKVYLYKNYYRDPEGLDATRPDDLDLHHLAFVTDQTGEFLISFDLLAADDVWLYIDASEHGYRPRFVNLNQRMGDSIYNHPGHSPVKVHVVLEKG